MNIDIRKLFKEDQDDRLNPDIRNNAKLLNKRDTVRRTALSNIIGTKIELSAIDYYHAAFIFHHGPTIKDSARAVELAHKSWQMRYAKGKRLYATCLDRLLIKQGKKQKFGTQYRKSTARSKWKLLPVDPKTTDEERKKYGIAPLKELTKNVQKLNERK